MEQVEWQNLDSTDIEDRATFKVVLLGAQVQAEEALYTFKHNVYPEQGVYWGTSKSAESYGWWTFHYLSDKAAPFTVTYVLQKPEDQYEKLRYVNYPSNVQVLCYAVDSADSYQRLERYNRELSAADPLALRVLLALRTESRDGEYLRALQDRGITPISTEQGQARARELQIAHYFELSARTRQGLKEFFEFFQAIADPHGTKRIDRKGELWTLLDKMPPVPPAPVARVDSTCLTSELRAALSSALCADVVFTLQDRVIYAHKVMLSAAASVFKELSLLSPDSSDHVTNRICANTLFSKVSEHATAGSRNNRVSARVRDDIAHDTFLALLEFVYTGTCKISGPEMASALLPIIAGSSLFHLQHICKNVIAGNAQANAAIFRLTQQHVLHHLAILHTKTRKIYSDMTLVVDGKHVTAHRVILASRSGYFRELFMKDPDLCHLEISDVSPAVFTCLLEFMYTGKVGSLNATVASELLTAAHVYRVEHVLVQCCEQALIKSELRTGLDTTTRAAAVLQSFRAAQASGAGQLLEYCAWYVGTHSDEFTEEQLLALARDPDWRARLERHQFPPKNTLVKGVKNRFCVIS